MLGKIFAINMTGGKYPYLQSSLRYQSEKLAFSVNNKLNIKDNQEEIQKANKMKQIHSASLIKELQIKTARRRTFSPLELTKF